MNSESVTNYNGPYFGTGVSEASGNPALDELTSSLTKLSSDANGADSDLLSASRIANDIASMFSGVNSSIRSSWCSIANFANAVDNKVTQLTSDFTRALEGFIVTTQEHEMKIHQATSSANDLAAELLTKLGLK